MAIDKLKSVDIIISKITEDLIPQQTVIQGERSGRSLVLQITNGGEIVDQTGTSVNLGWSHTSAKNSDGELLQGLDAFKPLDIKKGIFELEYPSGMLVPGIVNATIQIITSTSDTRSNVFKIKIEEAPFNDSAAESDNSFTALQDALSKATSISSKADYKYVDEKVASIVSGAPKDIVADYKELQSKYQNGTEGIVITADTGHWYYWKNGVWNDGGEYLATDLPADFVENKISEYGNYLPSNVITDSYLTANKSVTSMSSNLIVSNLSEGKYIKSSSNTNPYSGLHGIKMKIPHNSQEFSGRKKLSINIRCNYNSKYRIQIEYKRTDSQYETKTLKECFIVAGNEITCNIPFYPDGDFSELYFKIIQMGEYASPFYIREWKLIDLREENSFEGKVFTDVDKFYFDDVKFKLSSSSKGGTSWAKITSLLDSNDLQLKFNIPVTNNNSSTVEADDFEEFGYKVQAFVKLDNFVMNSMTSNKECVIKVLFCDRLGMILRERKVSNFYLRREMEKIDYDFYPSIYDIQLEKLAYFSFVLEIPNLQKNDSVILNGQKISLISRNNYDKNNYLIGTSGINLAANIAKTTIYNDGIKFNRFRVNADSMHTSIGESYIFKISNYKRDNLAEFSLMLNNNSDTSRIYALRCRILSSDGMKSIDRGEVRRIKIDGNSVEQCCFQYPLLNYSKEDYLVFDIELLEENGIKYNTEMIYTSPVLKIKKGQYHQSNLFGETSKTFTHTRKSDLAVRPNIFLGSIAETIRTEIKDMNENDFISGRAIFYPIFNVSDIFQKKIKISGQVYSPIKQKISVRILWKKKPDSNGYDDIIIDDTLGLIELEPNETKRFSFDFLSTKITTDEQLDEINCLYLSVGGLPNNDGLVSFYVFNICGELSTNSNLKQNTDTEDNLPQFNIIGDIADISKENKKNVEIEFRDGKETFIYFAKVKLQGDSSLWFPKKSYRIDFFSDDKRTKKLKIPIIPHERPLSSINLKANWIDYTSFNNNLIGKHHRNLCLINNDTYNERLRYNYSQQQCLFFPCNVYLNDDYNGLYTCSTKKGNAIDVDTDNPNEIAIQGVDYNSYTGFREDEALFDETDFEVIDGDLIEELKASFNRLMRLTNSSTDEEFISSIKNIVNLQSIANVIVVNIVFGNRDCFGKNTIWQTFDGTEWYAVSYDHDIAFGQSSNLNAGYVHFTEKTIQEIMNKNKLVERLVKLKIINPILVETYNKFRKNNNIATVMNDIDFELNKIGSYNYIRNANKWQNQPYTSYYDVRDLKYYIIRRMKEVDTWFTEGYLNKL